MITSPVRLPQRRAETSLEQNVAPPRGRANLVLRKGPDHKVQHLSLRKL